MKIGIDARFYSEAGGLGRYVRELIKELEKQDTGNFYVVFVNKEGWNDYQPTNPHFQKILADVKWYTLKEQTAMKKIISRQKVDLMHFPHWNVPLFYNGPFIATIHDLILLKYPSRRASTLDPLFYFIKNTAFRLVLKHAVQKAQKILTPSQFVKKEIAEIFDIKPEKISVTHEGVANAFLDAPGNLTAGAIFKKYRLRPPYLLYVGVAYPHKNLENLLEAFALFNQKNPGRFQLVLVGQENYFYRCLKMHRLLQSNLPIIFTGFVPDEELPLLYENASVFVFPSLYEGFGLPALEALARKVPVIASRVTAMPEILGTAALYFDPLNLKEMARAMARAFFDKQWRERQIALGLKQAEKYSWQNCAQLTLQAYRNSV